MNDYTTIESWRPVIGYEQYYSVSNHGRIRNEISRNRHYAGTIRIGDPNQDGYLRISLTANGKGRKVFVHKIVADAFLGECPPLHEVNHKNGIKTDNSVENLEYLIHQKNMEHAQATGLWSPVGAIGVDHPNAKLNPDKVRSIRLEHKQGVSANKLSKKYGVARNAIDLLLKGVTWKHVE